MDLQNEIQFLKLRLKSIRRVARHLGIDRETVAKYWNGIVSSPESNTPPWTSEIDWSYIQREIGKGDSLLAT